MKTQRMLVILVLLMAFWSMGMALDCSRSDDDDDTTYSNDDDDDDDNDDDAGDDDFGYDDDDDNDDNDTGGDDDDDDDNDDNDTGDDDDDNDDNDTGDDDDNDDNDTGDDDDDDTSPPVPEGFITGDWHVEGDVICGVYGVYGYENPVDGYLTVEHWANNDIRLFDGEQVGDGRYRNNRRLSLDFYNAWGFTEFIYEDPEDHEMEMDFFRVNNNRFEGDLDYRSNFYGWIDFVCGGSVVMTRQ